MIRLVFALCIAVFSLTSAQALELSWRGGAVATATSGCTGWDPLRQDWYAFLWPPLAGTTNTSASTFTIRDGRGAEGFNLKNNGKFTTAFKPVRAVHIFTGVGVYDAQIRLLSQAPATITTTTPVITGRLQIKGFDFTPTCLVTIQYSLVRHVDNP